MGFAKLSIADIAAEYNLKAEKIFARGNRLKINYKNERARLTLLNFKDGCC